MDAVKKKQAEEDAAWAAAGDGAKSKKKEDAAAKAAEAAARAAEKKKLLEEEEASMTKTKAKQSPAGLQKMTKYQLDQQKEADARAKEAELKEKNLANKREMSQEAYDAIVSGENLNRKKDDDGEEARNVHEALSVLGVQDNLPADAHPEKRVRAAWLAYEERQMVLVKEEKPGLKMSQYKDMIWKSWQKSPDNPLFVAGKI